MMGLGFSAARSNWPSGTGSPASGDHRQLQRQGPLADWGAVPRPGLGGALTAPGVDHDVNVYPCAGHGFISDPSRAAAASRPGRT
jgi:hypothetical protein